MAHNYIIKVTAGADYDVTQHSIVKVNDVETTRISGPGADIELNVRIKNYDGLPLGSSKTSPYFSQEPHALNDDQYSISFRFTPRQRHARNAKNTGRGISGSSLQFGNDFDHPIRDRLPPGFNTAMNIVKWWIDPGLDGDAYADRPHLYGAALSSINILHVGKGRHDPTKGGLWFQEGGDEEGMEQRYTAGMPGTSKARMKWALGTEAKHSWWFEYDKTYAFDFFNPYLDFHNLALKLPGFQLPIMKYWDGQGIRNKSKRSHLLRYVLRNKETDQVYMVVAITIHRREDIGMDGEIKAAAQGSAIPPNRGDERPSAEDERAMSTVQAQPDHEGPSHEIYNHATSAEDVD